MWWAQCSTHPQLGQHPGWLFLESVAVCSLTKPLRVVSCHRNIYSYRVDGESTEHFFNVSQQVLHVSDKSQQPETPRNIRVAKDAQKKVDMLSKGSVLGCCLVKSFSFPSLKRPRTLVLLTAAFWEPSPAGRCCTSCGRELAEAGWSWEKHPLCFVLFCFFPALLFLLGRIPFFSEMKWGDIFRGSLEESKVAGNPV